jgi:hypothetical protein
VAYYVVKSTNNRDAGRKLWSDNTCQQFNQFNPSPSNIILLKFNQNILLPSLPPSATSAAQCPIDTAAAATAIIVFVGVVVAVVIVIILAVADLKEDNRARVAVSEFLQLPPLPLLATTHHQCHHHLPPPCSRRTTACPKR